nr:MAG TPA: hypothetical protein [Caudoviricetes sp.]
MTAKQLTMILSNLDEQDVIIKYNDKQLNITGVELGINEHIGTIYVKVEE